MQSEAITACASPARTCERRPAELTPHHPSDTRDARGASNLPTASGFVIGHVEPPLKPLLDCVRHQGSQRVFERSAHECTHLERHLPMHCRSRQLEGRRRMDRFRGWT
jgi:nicotinamidase-related amidase